MKKLILIIAIITYSLCSAQNNEIFKTIRKISEFTFPKELTIAEVTFIDVNQQYYLITDRISKKVYLINRQGAQKVKELSVEKCDPGFTWRPIIARFVKDGILLLNSIPWGYRFSSDGNCLGKMDIKFVAPLLVSGMRNGDIIGFYNSKEPFLCIMDKYGEEKKKFGQFSNEFKNFLYRYEGGGLVLDEYDNIYQIDSYDWQIKKFDSNGKFTRIIGKKPPFFRKIEKDISNDPVKLMKEFGELIENKTTTQSMYLLAKNKILIQYFSTNAKRNRVFIQIVDYNGNELQSSEIAGTKRILFAQDNKLYFYNQPDLKNGILPNPKIEIYEFINN